MIDKLENDVDLLGRHLRVLDAVQDAEPIGIHRLAEETDMASHKARYSLRVLEENGVIEPTNDGARTTDATDGFVSDVDDRLDGVIDALEAMEGGR